MLSSLLTIVLLQNCEQGTLKITTPEKLNQSGAPQGDAFDAVREAMADEGLSERSEASPTHEESTESTAQALLDGKTYYVSKSGSNSDGLSKATAFRTIQQAATAAKAGDTVVVLAGIYKEWIKSNNDGTASARIRFVSEPRGAAKIAPTKDALAYWSSNGDYTDIDGFTFDSTLGDLPDIGVRGIQANGTGSRIMNNNIRFFRACTEADYYRGGVGIGTGAYNSNIGTEIFGNIIRSTRVPGCPLPPKQIVYNGANTTLGVEAAGYGIYLSTPSGKVYNNLISDFRLGIHLWHAPTEATVSHNLVFSTGPTGVGIIFGCGDKPYIQCKNITVSNNIFMHQKGAMVIREYGSNVSGTNRILNNIIFGNTTNLGGPSLPVSTVANAVVSSNLIGVDPKLMNYKSDGSGDYRLSAGSPAIDAATTTGAVSKDFNQFSRPTGKADIGPYEYGSTSILGATPTAPPSFTVK